MTNTDNFNAIIQEIPLVKTGITIGLFILVTIISKIIKGFISRKASTEKTEGSLINRLFHEEEIFIKKGTSIIMWIGFLSAAVFLWDEHLKAFFSSIQHLYLNIARAIIILVAAFLVHKASHVTIKALIEKVTPIAERDTTRGALRMQTLNHVFRYGATIVIFMVATLMLLQALGINIGAVLATVGVASVAIGFGAQSLVKDIIAGIFILSEDQYGVGDVVIINGEGGFVEKMTLRITQLRNTEGTLITVPNGSITNVKNMTSEWSRVDYKMEVAYETDLDHAIEVLMEEANKLKEDMPDEIIEVPERLGVDEFGDSSITIRIWIKTKPLKQWVVRRELNRRVHKRFDKEGIEIPFPQRTLWIKEPEEAIFATMVESRK